MAQFINTSSGYLNLDHILLIRVGIDKEAGLDLIQMSDGRTIQVQILGDIPGIPGIPTIENRSMPTGAATSPEGQKEAPVGGEPNGGEGSDAVLETPKS